MSPTIEGDASCCEKAPKACPIVANQEGLAQELLALAQKYHLSGFTGDWEFTDSFDWSGYNASMAHVAAVLRPHGLGLGNAISSSCEHKGYAGGSAPFCVPAYRNTPWASILVDMGTYQPVTGCGLPTNGEGLSVRPTIQ